MNNEFLIMLHDLALIFPAYILLLTFYGFFRAGAAWMLGDMSGKQQGMLTLNPLAHVNVIHLFMYISFALFLGVVLQTFSLFNSTLLLLFIIMFSAQWRIVLPIDERQLTSPRRDVILISLAGMLGCCVLALIFMYVLTYFPFAKLQVNQAITLKEVFSTIVQCSVFFTALQSIPLPPFDGGVILLNLLPRSLYHLRQQLEENSFIIAIVIFIFFDFFMPIINAIQFFIIHALSFLIF